MQDNFEPGSLLRDVQMLGLDPDLPYYDLNLAGTQGAPAPAQLASSSSPEENAPTFSGPDATTHPLMAHDLSGPGIDLHQPFAPDPALPDLTDYAHPYGLDVQPALREDPASPTTSDLPDFQHPDLEQQRYMQGHPGDLDASALTTMYQQATYQQLDDKTYPQVFLDQSGMNTSRTRHMDLLMRGLDEGEQ